MCVYQRKKNYITLGQVFIYLTVNSNFSGRIMLIMDVCPENMKECNNGVFQYPPARSDPSSLSFSSSVFSCRSLIHDSSLSSETGNVQMMILRQCVEQFHSPLWAVRNAGLFSICPFQNAATSKISQNMHCILPFFFQAQLTT